MAIDTETGLADLAEYSLLRWSETDREVVTVHRIVQDIARYRLPESERRGWLIRALRMLDDFCDGDPRNVRTWENLYSPVQPHLLILPTWTNSELPTRPLTCSGHWLCTYRRRRSFVWPSHSCGETGHRRGVLWRRSA